MASTTRVTSWEAARPLFNTNGPTRAVPGDLGLRIRDLINDDVNVGDDANVEEKGDGGESSNEEEEERTSSRMLWTGRCFGGDDSGDLALMLPPPTPTKPGQAKGVGTGNDHRVGADGDGDGSGELSPPHAPPSDCIVDDRNDDDDTRDRADEGGEEDRDTDVRSSASFDDFGSASSTPTSDGDGDGDDGVMMMITDSPQDVREKYSVEPDAIGRGQYGTVRVCRDRHTGEAYAVKSIPKSKMEGRGGCVRGERVLRTEPIQREVEILRDVDHPRIIRLYDVYEDATHLHLITELCTGGMLFDRVVQRLNPFPENEAAKIVKSILEAIVYLHDTKNIVHRDVKCENVLFETDRADSSSSSVKLIDFGGSRRHDPLSTRPMETNVGTVYYVAPEVLDRQYTKACDMWSVGVVTYMTLSGYYPFWGDSAPQIVRRVRAGTFDFPPGEWGGVSSHARDFVCRLLRTDPAERLTAAEALEHKWIVKHSAKRTRRKVSRGRGILKSLKSASSWGRSKSRGKIGSGLRRIRHKPRHDDDTIVVGADADDYNDIDVGSCVCPASNGIDSEEADPCS